MTAKAGAVVSAAARVSALLLAQANKIDEILDLGDAFGR
jgi:hypothetical protein